MWSLIPWRTLLKLALPFIREAFFGKFNAKNYFVKHPVITFCVVCMTIMTMLTVFITEQAIWHAERSVEYRERIRILEEQLNKKKCQSIEAPAPTPSPPVVEGSKEKEVVLVPTTPKPDPVHYVKPVTLAPVPVPKVPDPIPVPSTKAVVVYNYKYLNERLKHINEVE